MQQQWHNAARMVHMEGGGRVLNNPGPELTAYPEGGSWTPPVLAAYHDLFCALAAYGNRPIGCEFFTHHLQADGTAEPDWWPLYKSGDHYRTPQKVFHAWGHIGDHAAQLERLEVYQRAAIISTQLRICSWRLFDLSQTYSKHLRTLYRVGKFEDDTRADGWFSEFMYISAHAMFAELATLRDYLAAFCAGEIFGLDAIEFDAMPRLLGSKALAKIHHPVARALVDAGDWLKTFGDYRNIVTHNAPLSMTNGGWAEQHVIDTAHGQLRQVSLQLPKDPSALRRDLKSGKAEGVPPLRFKDAIAFDRTGPDALTYCWLTFGRLIQLADMVSKFSPVEPKMRVITDADIVGPIRYSEG